MLKEERELFPYALSEKDKRQDGHERPTPEEVAAKESIKYSYAYEDRAHKKKRYFDEKSRKLAFNKDNFIKERAKSYRDKYKLEKARKNIAKIEYEMALLDSVTQSKEYRKLYKKLKASQQIILSQDCLTRNAS